MRICGIDPGASGALVWLDGDGGAFELMPSTPKVGLRLPDLVDLLEHDRPDLVVVERAQAFPGMGVVGSFGYGAGYGQILGVLAALRIAHETVRPDVWHRDVVGRFKRGELDKAAARLVAKGRALEVVQRRLPRLELPRGKAAREAVVDAACVALWGRLHGSGLEQPEVA